jgi:polyribonucleotide nucleotidyltransferase
LIDRPIRPLFPKVFTESQELQRLSCGDENIADILGIISVSAALVISDIPLKPIAAVNREDTIFCQSRRAGSFGVRSEFNCCGTEEAVVMVEELRRS